jgi:antagonist of KipI
LSIHVIKAGIADSIQDMGRYGYQHLGINPNGVMDTIAAQAANLLVGNNLDDAVLELHFPASVFLFKQQALISICGADFGAMINDIEVPVNTPLIIEKNCVLQFKKPIHSARAYLAVREGFNIQPWLKSFSTNTKVNAGGFKGRNLAKHDELHLCSSEQYHNALQKKDCEILSWQASLKKLYNTDNSIRITAGAAFNRLTDDAKKRLCSEAFSISHQSDRMGYRMHGEILTVHNNDPLISSGVTRGTVQLLPDGQLIILMADHQTTGGYPNIAHVISTDVSKLAQMKPSQQIQFNIIESAQAEDLLCEQQHQLVQLQNACIFRLRNFMELYGLH